MPTYNVIGDDGRQYGPTDLETVRAWVAEGRIAPGTLIQEAGTTEWKAASAFPELRTKAPGGLPPLLWGPTTSPGASHFTPPTKLNPKTTRVRSGNRVLWAVSVWAVVLIVVVVVVGLRLILDEHSSIPRAGKSIASPTPPGSSVVTVPAKSPRSREEPPARSAAEPGDAEVRFRLGRSFASGSGVRQDYGEAAKWYRKAADQGHTQAQYELGRLYAQGLGVPRDNSEAAKWYRLAAEKEYVPAQHFLGHLFASGQGPDTAHLEAPDPPPTGQAPASAGQPVSRSDYVEAAKWWRKAADQGDAGAQSDLGWLYSNGRGVETDYVEAARWYLRSAEQGNSAAQHWLGHLYLNGRGVDQDEAEAFKWFRQAAEQGNVAAQGDLGRLYAVGRGVEQNSVEAIRWHRKAAEAGNPTVQNDFAWMLATSGNSTLRNSALALEFAEKAVAATRRSNASFLDTLAAAHAEAGDFEQAVTIQKEAIALLSDANSKQDYTSRLRLYEAKTPYRQEAK
jgi:TPR repeat protein